MLRRPARISILAFSLGTFAVAGGLAPAQAQTAGQKSAQPSPPAAQSQKSPASQSGPPLATQPEAGQKTFASPKEAADALYSAARNNNENEIIAILGPNSRDIVMWTDNAEDRKAETQDFTMHYEQMHRLVREPDGETTVYIGAQNWPLPIPIVESHGVSFFDTSLGRPEILYRRIGENEVETINTLQAIVDAQKEYYDSGAGGPHAYAARFDSSQGMHDGLYWPSNDNNSPLGPYVARASYDRTDRVPLHGYFFRILTAQGAAAPGGAKSYLANDKLTNGFAIAAFPADYRASGMKTFIVNQRGIVYERDLGTKTTDIASSMKDYNPNPAWHKVTSELGIVHPATAPAKGAANSAGKPSTRP